MAKKQAGKKKMIAPPKEEKTSHPVRLDLSPADYERLEKCARARGLTRSSFARMAVLKLIKEDEAES